ncbi:hypothetical protein SOVF_163700 [Spinacia oleracea]|nr:transcription factor TCP4-like isoform X2 [Spinacia oleracea]KNA08315.1 hypothetical protein SOVF_163700 [Spinacia oleracea]
MGLKNTTGGGGGDIVQVQGGHIIRATGRKDRHSKVFTAKGPRDRRVRLAAHTAIEFYDVQDRLGYDRPSKVVEWLMKKAQTCIDKLDELPPWDPTASVSHGGVDMKIRSTEVDVGDKSGSTSFYVPQCLDSQSVGDSMKSFFPSHNNTITSGMNYSHEFISRGGSQNSQDLCLSLHTLQDPGSCGNGQHHHHHHAPSSHDSALFQGSSSSLGFEGRTGEWSESQQQHDLGQFARMFGWPSGGSGGGGGGNLFNPYPLPPQGLLFGQQHVGPITTATFTQGSTLQSNFSPFVCVLEDHKIHNHHHQHHPQDAGNGSDGFIGYYVPSSQIHGGANSMSNNKASSSSMSPDSTQH